MQDLGPKLGWLAGGGGGHLLHNGNLLDHFTRNTQHLTVYLQIRGTNKVVRVDVSDVHQHAYVIKLWMETCDILGFLFGACAPQENLSLRYTPTRAQFFREYLIS